MAKAIVRSLDDWPFDLKQNNSGNLLPLKGALRTRLKKPSSACPEKGIESSMLKEKKVNKKIALNLP